MKISPYLLGVSWNPAIGLPEAVALALVFVAGASWLAWRGNSSVNWKLRFSLQGLRTCGLILLAWCWLNPGEWRQEIETTRRDWLVLMDRSGSMRAEHAEGSTRWQVGAGVAEELLKASNERSEVRIHPFTTQLEEAAVTLKETVPDGAGTDLGRAVTSALDQRSNPVAGIVVLSDGRSTVPAKIQEIALRARGRGIPIHTVPLGTEWGSRDLVLSAMPKQVNAFRGQPVKIAVQLENKGLGAIKPTVTLSSADGKEVASKDLQLPQGARGTVAFELPATPDSSSDYIVRTDAWPEEHIPSNNSDTIRVNVLDSRTRMLLLEGAPYWDSKFLAQLLRQQSALEILTVHRLNEERYFRVETAGAEPLLSADTVFPSTAEELARYDLIVFGKGADGFLNSARIDALHGFVRDQGGAVLFARGKPYQGRFPALETLEPVEWGESMTGGFQFVPLADSGANLFGAALPAADDRVWSALPPLEDVQSIGRLRPFARVFAEGAPEGRQTRLPLLVARRVGRGMVATVNADGLWRWDFRPEVREQGAVYQQFWVQLMQWCATYSEFRPGQDYAVRLRQVSGEIGQPVRATIAYRGTAADPRPILRIRAADGTMTEANATPLQSAEGGREWVGMVTPDQPGRYEIRVADKAKPEREEGEAILTVAAPLQETDDLRPDPESLAVFARESNGKAFHLENIDELARMIREPVSETEKSKPEWEPLWPRWWVALLLGAVFGGEWWIRRREGLL